jgi:hypothetical protein
MDCAGAKPVCRSTVQPGERLELCNGEDDDCDGTIDEGFDKDADGYSTCGGDCNDRDPAIHPDAAERCNERDDNCNGLIDDGFNIGASCTVGQGMCLSKGRLVCSKNDLEAACDAVPGEPSKEICNGKDDDCNGQVDDGLGEITCGVGACKKTVQVCEKGQLVQCTPGKPTAELCGDAIDNNCDGTVDEGFAELGRTCEEGVGACRNVGKFICSDDLLSLMCSAAQGEPRAEICGNKVDDDCDGIVDTDTLGLSKPCDNGLLGECHRAGEMVCDRSHAGLFCSAPPVEPAKETCDGKDNDCDGVVDNGVLNACGGCEVLPGKIGMACLVPGGDECATGIWTCDAEHKGGAWCLLDAKISQGRPCATDDNPCTNDVCSEGACTHDAMKDGLACDDQNACTSGESCVAGVCADGKPVNCDDENVCTDDTCDAAKGCLHAQIGVGVANSCGGCEKLLATPGSPCALEEEFGPCRVGQHACTPDGLVQCRRISFGTPETCNGLDDNCNGEIDEGLGNTQCGIGACVVEVARCNKGAPVACVPKDPLPETCANMGVDDDCNGVADDVAGLDEKCPVPIGTCIIPGRKRCLGDAEKPVCVPTNPRDAEDDDDNGVANYCEHDGVMEAPSGDEVGVILSSSGEAPTGSSTLFDLEKNRAAMLPWQEVYGSTVINVESSDGGILLVSGRTGERSGLAVLRAKDVSSSAGASFRTCDAAVGESPGLILAVDEEASAIAAVEDGYLRYHKIASQIPSPSAGTLSCHLYGERLPLDRMRKVKTSGGDVTCKVENIEDMALLGTSPLRFVGAAACAIQGDSILSRSRSAVLIDIVTQSSSGAYTSQSIPLLYSTGGVERAVVAPIGKGGGAFFASATIKNKGVIGICRLSGTQWKCDVREDRVVGAPIVSAHTIGVKDARTHVLALSRDGKAFDIAIAASGAWDLEKAGSAGGRGDVSSAKLVPETRGNANLLLIARERDVSAGKVSWTKDGRLKLVGLSGERFGPEAPADGIYSGGKFSFGEPKALESIRLKRYGGEDFFAAFQMKSGMRNAGEMGFLYLNANEPPHGMLSDIRVQGGSGEVKLRFSDPTGDSLTYRAWIRAGHGGSLDNWIDGLEGGVLRFSIKGDAVVGTWPIEITVEAADAGGATSSVRAVVDRDGTVESITERAGGK